MTVLEAIRKGAEFLERKGIESPRLQVELLLASILGLKRMELYLKFDQQLQPQQVDLLREMILRRARHEPLQYIIGCVNFCGLELKVSPAVLIPRPETEILAELGERYLMGLPLSPHNIPLTAQLAETKTASEPHEFRRAEVIDFGTGSGCLAIYLAVKCPGVHIWAVECSREALEIAIENAKRHNVADRIEFIHGDSLSAIPSGVKADLLISNPPYIPSNQIPNLQPEIRDFEPRIALDGGEEGLDVLRLIAQQGRMVLKPGGTVMVEFGDGQETALRDLFQTAGWVEIQFLSDDSGRARFLIAKSPTNMHSEKEF